VAMGADISMPASQTLDNIVLAAQRKCSRYPSFFSLRPRRSVTRASDAVSPPKMSLYKPAGSRLFVVCGACSVRSCTMIMVFRH
jgi:hypothetical protein